MSYTPATVLPENLKYTKSNILKAYIIIWASEHDEYTDFQNMCHMKIEAALGQYFREVGSQFDHEFALRVLSGWSTEEDFI